MTERLVFRNERLSSAKIANQTKLRYQLSQLLHHIFWIMECILDVSHSKNDKLT